MAFELPIYLKNAMAFGLFFILVSLMASGGSSECDEGEGSSRPRSKKLERGHRQAKGGNIIEKNHNLTMDDFQTQAAVNMSHVDLIGIYQIFLTDFTKLEENVSMIMIMKFYYSLDQTNMDYIKGKVDGNVFHLNTNVKADYL